MDPITLTAMVVTALLTGAAAGASQTGVTELADTVRESFRKRNKEGLLDRVGSEPDVIQAELIEQMKGEQAYHNVLQGALNSMGLTRQVILSDLESRGGIKLKDINLRDYGSHLRNLSFITGLKAVGDIEVSGVNLDFQKKTPQ